MKNIKMLVAYEGTNYLGWQETSTGLNIESQLKLALETVLRHAVKLQAASRTDAGVHAHEQVVNFFTSLQVPCLRHLKYRLNCLLPQDIAVLSVEEAEISFHPTLDCKGKEYHYHICTGKIQMPHRRRYSWHCYYPLDLEKMQHATQFLIGKQDFSALCNFKKNARYDNYIREVFKISIGSDDVNSLLLVIVGNHFLYKMVRNIVGTLVYVGRGLIVSEEIPLLLKSCKRTALGITAPAHGLFLHRVMYTEVTSKVGF